MRKPRDLALYEPSENIAAWLEKLAADIRKQDEGKLMRADLTLKWWHPDWETKPKGRQKLEKG